MKRGHHQEPLESNALQWQEEEHQVILLISLFVESRVTFFHIASYAKQIPSGQNPKSINEQSYQMSCIISLNQYLESHWFSGTLLSQKGLSSTKYVKDIISFLVHQLDPSWGELGKLENEVPFIFRVYRYPFQINKSALSDTRSTRSWPTLMAALSWLIQLLNYKERVHQGAQWFDRDAGFKFPEHNYRNFL